MNSGQITKPKITKHIKNTTVALVLGLSMSLTLVGGLFAKTEDYIPQSDAIAAVQGYRIAQAMDVPELSELFSKDELSYAFMTDRCIALILPQPDGDISKLAAFKNARDGMISAYDETTGIYYFIDEDSFLAYNGEVILFCMSFNKAVDSALLAETGFEILTHAGSYGPQPWLNKLDTTHDISIISKANIGENLMFREGPDPQLQDFLLRRMNELYGKEAYSTTNIDGLAGSIKVESKSYYSPDSRYADFLNTYTERDATYDRFIKSFGEGDILTLGMGLPKGLFGAVFSQIFDQKMINQLLTMEGQSPQIGLFLSGLAQLGGSFYLVGSNNGTAIPDFTFATTFADANTPAMLMLMLGGSASEQDTHGIYRFDIGNGLSIYAYVQDEVVIAANHKALILSYINGDRAPMNWQTRNKLMSKSGYMMLDLTKISILTEVIEQLQLSTPQPQSIQTESGLDSAQGLLNFAGNENGWTALSTLIKQLLIVAEENNSEA